MELLKMLRAAINCSSFTTLIVRNRNTQMGTVFLRSASTEVEKDKKEEDIELYSIADDDYEIAMIEREQELERKRNKSLLNPAHQNIIHGKVPYDRPMNEAHLTLRYKKRIFGRYGHQSNVNPGALWPNEDDIRKTLEYEKIAYPYSIQEMIARERAKLAEEEKAIRERQQKISNNLQKLEAWKKDIEARSAKRLADLAKAQAKKDALIEEVRKHFGYKLDQRDEKFKEMLLIKERAQKKKLKEERSKAKHERLLAEMMKDS